MMARIINVMCTFFTMHATYFLALGFLCPPPPPKKKKENNDNNNNNNNNNNNDNNNNNNDKIDKWNFMYLVGCSVPSLKYTLVLELHLHWHLIILYYF